MTMNEQAFEAARKTAFDLGWSELADEHPADLRAIIARYLDALPKRTDRIAVCRFEEGDGYAEIVHGDWDDEDWERLESSADFDLGGAARYIVHASVPPPEPREVVEVSGEVETIDG